MPYSFTNVFKTTFSILGKAAAPLAIVTFLLSFLPSQVISIGLQFGIGINMATPQSWQGSLLPVTLGVTLVLYFLAAMNVSAVTEVAIRASENKQIKLGEVIQHSVVNALPVILIFILCALGWMLFSIFLFIPAFIFGTIFSVVVPAYVSEKTGIFKAFGRSRFLTKGHRWGIFGLWCVVMIVFYVLVLAVEMPFLMPTINAAIQAQGSGVPAATPPMPSLPIMVVLGLASSVVGVVILAFNAAVYACLRTEKDKTSGAAVSAIFE